MLFAWVGFLKEGQQIPQEINQQTSDFVAQPYIDVHSFGPLYDEKGERAAMLMIFDIDDWTKAQKFVETSPYLKAGLYDRYHLYEYRNEAG
jgi:hypothetical protein